MYDLCLILAIHEQTQKFEDDYVSAFWLSNTYELLNIVKTARQRLPRPSLANQDDEQSATAVLAGVQNQLKMTMSDIYNRLIVEQRVRLSNMIVSAVIENQTLPGYHCPEIAGPAWNNIFTKASTLPPYTLEQLVNFLNKLSKTMTIYFLDELIQRQILVEILRVVGVSAFNHLLMRKNFCTWKRGVQIQYNVSRLDDWCLSHGVAEASMHLQQLLQAAKLLTLGKSTAIDIEMIYDVCFLLNATQIKKLLTIYYADDFDAPVCELVF